jgi:hypothetical protein
MKIKIHNYGLSLQASGSLEHFVAANVFHAIDLKLMINRGNLFGSPLITYNHSIVATICRR